MTVGVLIEAEDRCCHMRQVKAMEPAGLMHLHRREFCDLALADHQCLDCPIVREIERLTSNKGW